MLRDLSGKKTDYELSELIEKDLDKDPFLQFQTWLDFAVGEEIPEANAMVLSTVSYEGKPSSRIVLLKALTKNGLIFYTNYNSKKGIELKGNPFASLVFFWPQLERQVRVEGVVEKISAELSDSYFDNRELDSKVGAIISPQSKIIPNREFLIDEKIKFEKENSLEKLVRPEYWGGYILKPEMFEFWQGRPNRLNDRLQYSMKGNEWIIQRLAP